MIEKEKQVLSEQLELFEVDFAPDTKPVEYEVEVAEGFDWVVITAEAQQGQFSVSVDGVDAEQVSEYRNVRTFLGRIVQGTKKIAIRISIGTAKGVKLTVALLKRIFKDAIDQLPCKACKSLMRMVVSAVLAHLGVPYFDAEETVKMPGIDLDALETGKDYLSHDDPIDVVMGEPIEIGEAPKAWFYGADAGDAGPLAAFFNDVDPRILKVVRGALDAMNWLLDSVAKVYTRACEMLACCNPAPVKAS